MLKQTRGLLTGARWLLPASALWMFGCPNEELAPIEPCTVSGVVQRVTTQGADEVDLLFMIDNSGSMATEQEALAVQLPMLAQILASGELPREDGTIRKFTPVRSLHLGVISSDIGLSGAPNERPVTSCEDALGDDGRLLTTPAPGCGALTTLNGNHLNFTKDMTDPAVLGTEFGCITKLGTSGCGLEQQLESMLKAVTPSTSATKFTAASPNGQADSPSNAGFLRDTSVVALVAVTDEEDCSVPDSAATIFTNNTTDPRFVASNGKAVGLNSRCAVYGDPAKGILHPASRYIEGFKALRPSAPDLVIFAAIAGVPVDAENMVDANGIQDFDGILGLDAMVNKFNNVPGLTPENVEELTATNAPLPDPACISAGGGAMGTSASPARRFVEVAKGFGANGVIRSICASSFASALNEIVDKIASKLTGACLDRTLNPNNQGIVECDIVEYLPVGKTLADCDPAKGRTPADNPMRTGDDKMTHTVCKINQVAVTKSKQGCVDNTENALDCLTEAPGSTLGLVGWYYDDFTAEVHTSCGNEQMKGGQRIGFTVGAEPGNGSQVRFECLQPVFTVIGDPEGKDTVNKSCDGTQTAGVSLENLAKSPQADCKSDEQYQVRCETLTNTCQIMCQADANCPESWVCERREGVWGFCVNPTCPQ
jgi:hypothetical protein